MNFYPFHKMPSFCHLHVQQMVFSKLVNRVPAYSYANFCHLQCFFSSIFSFFFTNFDHIHTNDLKSHLPLFNHFAWNEKFERKIFSEMEHNNNSNTRQHCIRFIFCMQKRKSLPMSNHRWTRTSYTNGNNLASQKPNEKLLYFPFFFYFFFVFVCILSFLLFDLRSPMFDLI